MNEVLIERLFIEAQKQITSKTTKDFANKFTELIVRECVQVGGPEDSYTDEWFKAKADSVNKIREHFGVEE